MCGIAGYVGEGDEQILGKMIETIKYRGSDDQGFFVKDNVGLSQARLSIIDLSSAGHQPMSNRTETVWLVFNGEIYNFQELREELIITGKYQFKSKTDTEVIIYLYEEYGESFLGKLNGMFAIALYDFKKRKLILVRDRVGKKPLYWSVNKKTLIFGSEIKSLLAHPAIQKEINHLAVYQFFSFDYVPQPNTIFKNINKLENGTYLLFDNGEIKIEKYYSFNTVKKSVDFDCSLITTENLLSDAVKKRLVADVPVGVFLSGGLDSSLVAYFAKQHKKDIITISIGFNELTFDESVYAQEVATFLHTEHYHKNFTPTSLLEILPEIFCKLDEPFGDASFLPTYALSKFAKEKVTVALGGDGGDEVFMGYPNHQAQKIAFYTGLSKLTMGSGCAKILERFLPISEKNLSFFYKVKRYAHSLSVLGIYRDFLNIGAYFKGLEKLFTFETKEYLLFDFSKVFLGNYKDVDYRDKVNLLFLKYYLQDDIMFKVDRASMYNSLEVRAPILDYRLVDYANSLPLSYRLHGFNGKYLLKKLMENKLPQRIIDRNKKGFGVPMASWLRNGLKTFVLESLNNEKIKRHGLIDYKKVDGLLKNHFSQKSDNHKIIWNLIVFQKWFENFIQ